MASLDDLLARLRDAARAEFAFALTRDGELVTKDAPRDMPEAGRARLVRAAVSLKRREVSSLSLPRSELVPYGGPLPIDVSFAVAGDKLVCVVMTSSETRAAARAAIEAEHGAIEAFLASPQTVAGRVKDDAPRITLGPDVDLGRDSLAAIRLDVLRGEVPRITLGPVVDLGRESLAAIQLDSLRGEAPRITVEPAPKLGRESLAAIERDIDQHDAPQITVEVARKIGRETLAAIDKELTVTGPPIAAPAIPPEIRRRTLPWIDASGEKAGKGTG